jgi:hypothetical protein
MGQASKSYLVWYHSNSHKKDRFFTGVEKMATPIGVFDKPAWSYSKDESQIFDSLAEAQSAKAYCEKCQYTNIQIEPIDNTPIWVPGELVEVDKPTDLIGQPLKALEMDDA